MTIKFTRAGLPNSCSNCGRPAGPYWFANNVDEARSGNGICKTCAIDSAKLPDELPLESISGIGRSFAMAFAHLGIITIDELATANPEQIAEPFAKHSGHAMHVGRVPGLIALAQQQRS